MAGEPTMEIDGLNRMCTDADGCGRVAEEEEEAFAANRASVEEVVVGLSPPPTLWSELPR